MKHLKISVIQKNGRCPHNVGDTWKTSYTLIKPVGNSILCDDAHYALIPYLGMASGDASSWETDGKWRIHCPSKSGIIFEISILDEEHSWPTDSSWSKNTDRTS
jgi:uncharacterized repeat protein (TIGR04076 family)